MSIALSKHGRTVRYAQVHGVSVDETWFTPGLRLDEHTHDTGYVCIVLDGRFTETASTRAKDATPGCLYYVPPGTPHSNTFGASGARTLLLELGSEAIEWLGGGGANTTDPWCTVGGIGTWRGLRLYAALRAHDAAALEIEAFLIGLFSERRSEGTQIGRPPEWLLRVREALDAAPACVPGLVSLSKEAGVHPMHLLRAFRVHFGCAPGEYLQTRRVTEACRLLLDEQLTLARIALTLRFYDQSHFSRAFKTRIGVSPGAYRKQCCAASMTEVRNGR